jgi:hypothetical protein
MSARLLRPLCPQPGRQPSMAANHSRASWAGVCRSAPAWQVWAARPRGVHPDPKRPTIRSASSTRRSGGRGLRPGRRRAWAPVNCATASRAARDRQIPGTRCHLLAPDGEASPRPGAFAAAGTSRAAGTGPGRNGCGQPVETAPSVAPRPYSYRRDERDRVDGRRSTGEAMRTEVCGCRCRRWRGHATSAGAWPTAQPR